MTLSSSRSTPPTSAVAPKSSRSHCIARTESADIDAWLAVGLARGRGGRRGRRSVTLVRDARGRCAIRGVLLDTLRGREDFRFPASHRVLELPPRPPDVLHLHNLHGGYFDLRVLPELSARQPTVVTMHDEWLYTGHCAYTLDSERWLDGVRIVPAPRLLSRAARRRDG